MKQENNQVEELTQLADIIVDAEAVEIGVKAMLSDLGVRKMILLGKVEVGSSFKKWPNEHIKLIAASAWTLVNLLSFYM